MKKRKQQKGAFHQRTSSKIQVSSAKCVDRQEGLHYRFYPARSIRNATIAMILNKKPSNRTGLDWWHLGEYQIVNGLLDQDESVILSGEQSLLEGAMHEKPNQACLIDLGWLQFNRGSVVQAKRYFLDAIAINSSSRDAWAFLGLVEIALNNREKSLEAFENAVKYSQDSPHKSDIYTLKLLRGSETIPDELKGRNKISKFSIEEISKFSPEDQAKALRISVDLALEAGLDELTHKNMLDALCNIEYTGLGNLKTTIETCHDSIAFADTTHTPHLLLGLAYNKLGNTQLAIRSYERCIELNSNCVLAAANLSQILLDAGKKETAFRILQSISDAELDLDFSGVYFNNLGNTIAALGLPILDELECREKALHCEPQNAKFILNYILSLLVNGNHLKANELLKKHKNKIVSSLGSDSIVLHELLIKAISTTTDPFGLLICHENISPILGRRDTAFLLVKAWDIRQSFVDEFDGSEAESKGEQDYKYPDFLNQLGIELGASGQHLQSLQCWRELMLFPGYENASWNIPVSLDAMGLHQEAIESLDLAEGECSREYTIKGNILFKSDPERALCSYLHAIKHDEAFLLPIQKCLDLVVQLNRREYLSNLIDGLQKISPSIEKEFLIAQIKLEQGFHSEACLAIERFLKPNDVFIGLDELHERITSEKTDPTLLGNHAPVYIYKKLAKSYLIAERYHDLAMLIDSVEAWDVDMDGDWRIIASISLTLQGRTDEAIMTLDGMANQPPPYLAKAFAYIHKDDFEQANEAIQHVHETIIELDGYTFPVCKPSAFRPTFQALSLLDDGYTAKAICSAAEALEIDPSSEWVTDVYLRALDANGEVNKATDLLFKLTKYAPGNIKLVRRLATSLLAQSRLEECQGLLKSFCDTADLSGQSKIFDLKLAIDALAEADSSKTSRKLLPGWALLLDQRGSTYLQHVFNSEVNLDDAYSQSGLFLSIFCEHVLKSFFFLPLAEQLDQHECIQWEWSRNASSYLCTRSGQMPTMGDIIALIQTMSHPANRSNPYICMLIAAANKLPVDCRLLLSRTFGDGLILLRNYRNKIMHANPTTLNEYIQVRRFILGNGDDGSFVLCLCRPDRP